MSVHSIKKKTTGIHARVKKKIEDEQKEEMRIVMNTRGLYM